MSKTLLKEYLTLVLEKIRSKKVKTSRFGNKFELKKLQTFDNINVIINYADTFLDKLGQGSSRAAYLLNSKTVLKVAINEKGLAQNEAEVDVFTNPKSKLIVAKIHKADKDYKWVISDLVNPIYNKDEFAQGAGVDWKTFYDVLENVIRYHDDMPSGLDKFTQAVITTAKENKLLFGDLSQIDHWGKAPDGRVVLLDYGFTQEVSANHYTKKSEYSKTSDRDSDDSSDNRTNYTTNNSSDKSAATRK
jgi:hypothetical protein